VWGGGGQQRAANKEGCRSSLLGSLTSRYLPVSDIQQGEVCVLYWVLYEEKCVEEGGVQPQQLLVGVLHQQVLACVGTEVANQGCVFKNTNFYIVCRGSLRGCRTCVLTQVWVPSHAGTSGVKVKQIEARRRTRRNDSQRRVQTRIKDYCITHPLAA
jgi:hypothetical protein